MISILLLIVGHIVLYLYSLVKSALCEICKFPGLGYVCDRLNIECDNLSITKFDVNNHQKLELFSKGYEDNKKYFES